MVAMAIGTATKAMGMATGTARDMGAVKAMGMQVGTATTTNVHLGTTTATGVRLGIATAMDMDTTAVIRAAIEPAKGSMALGREVAIQPNPTHKVPELSARLSSRMGHHNRAAISTETRCPPGWRSAPGAAADTGEKSSAALRRCRRGGCQLSVPRMSMDHRMVLAV